MKPLTSKIAAGLSAVMVSLPLIGIYQSSTDHRYPPLDKDGDSQYLNIARKTINNIARGIGSLIIKSSEPICSIADETPKTFKPEKHGYNQDGTPYLRSDFYQPCVYKFEDAGKIAEKTLNSDITFPKGFAGWAMGGLLGFFAAASVDKRRGKQRSDLAVATNELSDDIGDTATTILPFAVATDLIDDGKINASSPVMQGLGLAYGIAIAAMPYVYSGAAIYKNFIAADNKKSAPQGALPKNEIN